MVVKFKPRIPRRVLNKKRSTSSLKRFFSVTMVCSSFLILVYSVFWCITPSNFPITSVKLIGNRHYLSQDDLRGAIKQEIEAGFFGLKLSNLQQQLLSLPWIKNVQIRRIWPNQLEVRFEEHEPAAQWGDKGILSNTGILFYPQHTVLDEKQLPVLQGPAERHAQVWNQFLEIEKALMPVNLKVSQLVLAPRGAWHLQLSNGVTVILGTNDIMTRLARFVSTYEKQLYTRQSELASVDLRYTSGMAISWKAS